MFNEFFLKTDKYGNKRYYKNVTKPCQFILHREDGPAIEWINGNKYWYINGKLHREDGPAIECVNGEKRWFINDKLHREDGPAIECVNGTKEWYLNGKRHREDGPACEWTENEKMWFINGFRHRLDGPAHMTDFFNHWYYWDKKIECSSQEEFERIINLMVFI